MDKQMETDLILHRLCNALEKAWDKADERELEIRRASARRLQAQNKQRYEERIASERISTDHVGGERQPE
jgi:hypothetical protein